MSFVDRYLDKTTLFILGAVLCIQYRMDIYIVVPLICVIIISAFLSYIGSDRAKILTALFFFAVCVCYPVFLFFLPLIFYDVLNTRYQYAAGFGVIPAAFGFLALPPASYILIILISGLAYLMYQRTVLLERARGEYIALRDSTKEFSLLLEHKNKELMDKQDYEIHLATLNERNRIARDIHDSVGHVLSNALLQTGALMAACGDEAMKERLKTLKDTLILGMDSVRSSIHDLYDDSIDLYAEIKRLTDGFKFCTITLDYDMDGAPNNKVKYTILSVVREALSNIIRHSDATQVLVTLREHPALYQLIIRDNGTKKEPGGDGIGLKNITQRVESIGGIVNISFENGFSVFISLNKPR